MKEKGGGPRRDPCHLKEDARGEGTFSNDQTQNVQKKRNFSVCKKPTKKREGNCRLEEGGKPSPESRQKKSPSPALKKKRGGQPRKRPLPFVKF